MKNPTEKEIRKLIGKRVRTKVDKNLWENVWYIKPPKGKPFWRDHPPYKGYKISKGATGTIDSSNDPNSYWSTGRPSEYIHITLDKPFKVRTPDERLWGGFSYLPDELEVIE